MGGRVRPTVVRYGAFLAALVLLAACAAPAARRAGPPPPAVPEPAAPVPSPVPSPPVPSPPAPSPAAAPAPKALPAIGYTIQAGAFAQAENAARLTAALQQRGLDATWFVAGRGLYKVRFGNFPTREAARARALALRDANVIEEFYVVRPDQHAAAGRDARGEGYLRDELLRVAQSFLGVPYLWGGTSAETGFDCSGLAMTVYRLCGLDLPRSSRDQYEAGRPVERDALRRGDLLFFAEAGREVSHVAVYAGEGRFIHAPGQGRRIRTDSLANGGFSRRFVGARSYLDGPATPGEAGDARAGEGAD